jgi:hypothetical protein
MAVSRWLALMPASMLSVLNLLVYLLVCEDLVATSRPVTYKCSPYLPVAAVNLAG